MNFSIPVSDVRSFIAAARKGDLSQVSTLERPKQREFTTISNRQVINDKLIARKWLFEPVYFSR